MDSLVDDGHDPRVTGLGQGPDLAADTRLHLQPAGVEGLQGELVGPPPNPIDHPEASSPQYLEDLVPPNLLGPTTRRDRSRGQPALGLGEPRRDHDLELRILTAGLRQEHRALGLVHPDGEVEDLSGQDLAFALRVHRSMIIRTGGRTVAIVTKA